MSAPEQEKDNQLPWPSYRKFYFLKEKPQTGNFFVLCKLCKEQKKASLTSCSNLMKHLKARHRMALEADQEAQVDHPTPKRARLSAGVGRGQTNVRSLFTEGKRILQARLDELVVDVVVENRLPFRFVESRSFKSLVGEVIPPNCRLMCEKTLRNRVQSKLEEMKTKLKAELLSVASVCATADAWKARGKAYVAVTVHWLHPQTMERFSAALALRRVIGSQTFEVLASLLESIFNEYSIEEKVSSVVTDNGSNFCKAFRVFANAPADQDERDGEDDEEDEVEMIELDPILTGAEESSSLLRLPPHRRCASHTLSRVAVHDVEKEFEKEGVVKSLHDSVMAKCRAVWTYQSRSTLSHDSVKEKLGTLFIIPNETRWNSKYDALAHMMLMVQKKPQELREIFTQRKKDFFTANELIWLKEYLMVMQPLADSLDILQQEKHVSVGYLLPTLHRLLQTTSEVLAGTGTNALRYLKPVAKCIRESVQSRFRTQLWERDLVIAACLEPMFRLDWIRDFVEGSDDKVEEARRWVLEAAEDMEPPSVTQPEASAAAAAPETGTNANNSFRRLFNFSQNRKRLRPTLPTEGVELFLSGAGDESDEQYKKLFIKFNTCIPSSAPVERFFSRAKLVLVPGRSRLTDQNFEILVLLEANAHLKEDIL